MTRRRSEDRTLLWVGMGCGGAFLALLVLGGGVTALWALGHLGHRRGADAAGAGPERAPNPVVPFLPAGNPFVLRRLTAAKCAKLKLDMTEAEVKALLGPPTAEMPGIADVKGMGGMAERMADQWPVKVFSYQEGANQLWVHFNRTGHLVLAQGEVDGQPVALVRWLNPFENLPPGELGKQKPFERFPANPFFPGGMPGMPPGGPGNPFAPPGGAGAPPQRP
jgi:hypothetical protein